MKKMMFALMAAVLMALTLAACGGKKAQTTAAQPEVKITSVVGLQLTDLNNRFVSYIKGAHINSQADADAMRDSLQYYRGLMAEADTLITEYMKGLNQDQTIAFAQEMRALATKYGNLETDLKQEAQRLRQEAAAAGVSTEGLDLY